jgi:hypothetical protein
VGIVAVGTALTLWATGVLDYEQTFAGFGDPAVIFIASLFGVRELVAVLPLRRRGDEAIASAESAKELSHIADQDVGDFHSWEVTAFVEL